MTSGLNDYTFIRGIDTNVYANWCECYEFLSEILLLGTQSFVAYTEYMFTSTQHLVSALSEGMFINSSMQFTNLDAKIAYRIIPDWSFYYVFEGGDWFPEAIDKYVGIRFADSLECKHYGWIRCSVEDAGSKLTIKDYAYETKCDVGIMAGDTIGDTTVATEEINTLTASAYSYGKTIYIKTLNVGGCKLTISNLQGHKILSQDITETFLVINMEPHPPGVYFVKLTSGDKLFIKKVIID